MNFLCDQCKQKYHVADEKIRGRAVTRFKCKKCEHVIELRMPEGAEGADAGASDSLAPDKDLSGVTAAPSIMPPAPRPTGVATGPQPTAARPAGSAGAALPTRQPTGTGLPVARPAPPAPGTSLPTRQPTGTGMSTAAARAASSPLPTRQPTGTGLPTASAVARPAPPAPGTSLPTRQPTGTGLSTSAAKTATAAATASPLRKGLTGTVEGPQKTGTAASALLNASETGWYAGVRDVPVGPLTRNELATKIEAGDIHADSLVWREGLDDWRPLRSVQELSELVRNAAQKMSGGLLGDMGRPAPGAGSGGKVVPISQARASDKPAARPGFGEGEEDDSPTQMHTMADLIGNKDPKASKAAARVADALAPKPAATPAPTQTAPRKSVPPAAPAPSVARASVPPPAPAASATTSSKPGAEASPGASGWSWGAPGAAPPANAAAPAPAPAPATNNAAAAPAPRPFATLNNAPVAKLPPTATDPLAMGSAPMANNALGLPSLGAPMPPAVNSLGGGAAIGENTRVALGLPAPAKKGGVPMGVWVLMAGMCAACLAVGLILGTRNNNPAATPNAPVAASMTPVPAGPTPRPVGTEIAVPTGDLPPSNTADNSAPTPPMPGESAAQTAARRAREHERSNTVAAAGNAHAAPAPTTPAYVPPEPGPIAMAPMVPTRSAAPQGPAPQGPTGAERGAQILGVINRAQAVGGCWNQATRRNPAHRNEAIQVAVDVAPNGRATSVHVTGAADDADLVQCIQLRIRSTIFPPGEAVSARASYSLSPGH